MILVQLPVAYTLYQGKNTKLPTMLNHNINKVLLTTIVNPECENQYYDFGIININN